jgi:hypothetical protein
MERKGEREKQNKTKINKRSLICFVKKICEILFFGIKFGSVFFYFLSHSYTITYYQIFFKKKSSKFFSIGNLIKVNIYNKEFLILDYK